MPDMRDITKECSACCDELPNYELVSVESDLVCPDCTYAEGQEASWLNV